MDGSQLPVTFGFGTDWLGRKESNLDMAISNRTLLPVREELQNPIALEFTSVSKHSNFENRTESAESRALERNDTNGPSD